MPLSPSPGRCCSPRAACLGAVVPGRHRVGDRGRSAALAMPHQSGAGVARLELPPEGCSDRLIVSNRGRAAGVSEQRPRRTASLLGRASWGSCCAPARLA